MIPVILACLLLLLGCAAPHDNPLDPLSPRHNDSLETPALPAFTAHVWSEHVSYRLFSDLYKVSCEFGNPDTTFVLDSVWVTYDGRPRVALTRQNGIWAGSFGWSYFGCGQTMDCAIGQPFAFEALDWQDSLHQAGLDFLFRVIQNVPEISEPDSQDVIAPRPVLLEWPPFNANFPFGFLAEVVDSLGLPVWTSPLLPSAQLLTQIPDSLADGQYQWTLTVIDSFRNTSRSKEAQFSVSSGVPL